MNTYTHGFLGSSGSLMKLAQKGLLSRIERGKYCRHNFRDELVIGSFLVRNGGIAYWSALNQHGLTEQFANTVVVQTSQEKKAKRIFGVDYKFVKVHPRKVLGYEPQGYGISSYKKLGQWHWGNQP